MAVLHPYHATLMELLASHPPQGHGHAWMFRLALHLRHYHNEETCFQLLRKCTQLWAHRAVPDSEIRTAVAKAHSAKPTDTRSGPAWPTPSPSAIAHILRTTTSLFTLTPLNITAEQALRRLFHPDDLICAGVAQGQGSTQQLRDMLPLADRRQFIVPSPMTAPWGINQQGARSFRTLDNTGPRKYLVIENDAASKTDQAKILTHLASLLPLILVVDSAGKSLHGWFLTQHETQRVVRRFMRHACTLGADPHTWNKCQWVRMPGGTRYPENKPARPQPILYIKER